MPSGRYDPVTADLHREHWTVPAQGLTRTDPDCTVILNSTCGHCRTTVRLDTETGSQTLSGMQFLFVEFLYTLQRKAG